MGKPKKDSMVESGYWNGFVNGVPGDDTFHGVINLLDSMESLEGDNSVDAEDWEAQFQSLGPIPLEVLQGFAHVSQANNCNDMQGFCPNNFVPSDGTSELKLLPDVVEVSSDSSRAKKSSLFHTRSPISVLESSGSYSVEKSMSTSPELLIPVRTRSKRHQRSTFCKWHFISPITPSEKTLNKKGKEKKRKKPSQLPEDSEVKENHQHMHSKTCTHCQVTQAPRWREGPMGPRTLCNACGVRYQLERKKPSQLPEDSEVKENHQHMHSKTCTHCQVTEAPRWKEGPMGPRTPCNACGVHYRSERKKPSQLPEDSEVKENHQHMHRKTCTHCQVTKTPQWREGPMGPRTLCNACGVRYRSGRLLPEYRPLASPTFVPSLHSNSHRKVIQMRNKVIQESSMPKMNPAMLPPPEIFPMKVMKMRNKVILESSMPEMNPAMLPPTEFFPMKVMQMRNEVVQESLVPEMDPAMSPPPEFVPMSSYLFDHI